VVLDVATGEGRWARPAAAAATSAGRVIAFASALQELADVGGAGEPAWARIERAVAHPAALPVRTGSVDLALWVTTPAAYDGAGLVLGLAEVRRVTRPGSRVVVSFPLPADAVPVAVVTGCGFGVAHLSEERWAGRPFTLLAVRRG
jgi:ubiquinone/menaquinone biosynthesis C-methylase UbiE